MPLLDHFHPPLLSRHHWESFPSNWATRLADSLNEHWLPTDFVAEEHTHLGSSLEIDVATFEQPGNHAPANANASAIGTATTLWAPPIPARTMPAVFPDSFEVKVFFTVGGMTLVGAIEIVSPGNKDRPEERRAFASKCASYVHQGVSVIILDVVTSRRANLHNELMRLLEAAPENELPAELELYGVAYRPVRRQSRDEIDFWHAACAVGATLPTLPLRLTGDLFVPVDFESTYREACRRRRLA